MQLKDTAERILAVDRAAAMVDEMLKQGLSSLPSSSIFPTVAGSGVKVHMPCNASFTSCNIEIIITTCKSLTE